ncbi:MAG TPA: SUMF1/EgtB/PvdO family nonheme iron enzyme, partial [Pirellulales bacterium]|nr:SUMF1/EgtB/PvdO family nonheme iron enzyme [Pirellulales bacterium]
MAQRNGGNYPVGYLVAADAAAFCKWLSQQYAARYELPSDEEWEYACPAGTTGDRFCPDDRLTEYVQDTNDLAPVGQKLPNPFGLYDMLGNQEELVDVSAGPLLRGGSGQLKGLGLLTSRSAFREPIWKNGEVGALLQGFRVAIVGDLKALVAPLHGNEPWKTPAFERWVTETQALPAEGQLAAVARKLKELNPEFDGKLTGFVGTFRDSRGGSPSGPDAKSAPTIEQGAVTALGFYTDKVRDISPLRALRQLRRLSCRGSDTGKGALADLSPLQGSSLNELNCRSNPIADLSKLVGLPIESLNMGNTYVRNLDPLRKLPLKRLGCDAMPISNLKSLRGMQLTELRCPMTLVSDLSPLAGMRLTRLECFHTKVSSLAPLSGMPLETLHSADLRISDLSPLAGMPLKRAHFDRTQVADLTPLESCKSLRTLSVDDTKVTTAALKALRTALPDCKISCK